MEQILVLLLISIIKKDVLVLGKGPTKGLEHILTAEKWIQLILLKLESLFSVYTKMEEIVTYMLMVQKW